ncbi:hypothetical protein ACTL6P_21900 [Endozoicomonas acroporae]|uniref:hypothetical protein n=1 Tax=Endozoicomonas acroporae TaxID=1701104 RepID=UPI000C7612BE|nr:hypothetical protein [Endozoicomonas acroporae]
MSGSGFTVKDCSQQSGLVFGLRVDQTTPNNYINPLITYSENFHNPFNDSRFKKIPVKVIYSQEPEKIKLPDISHKSTNYQEAEQNNRILSNQSEIRIEQVWSMVDEVSSHSYGLSNDHLPLISTLQETAGNELDVEASVSGAGKSLTSGHDNTYVQPEKRRASKRARTESNREKSYRKAYRESARGKAVRKAWLQSERGKACQKAYAKSEKGRACQKSYAQSERGKAVRKAWSQSERGKACRRAYAQSERGKAAKRAWEQSEKGKAYRVSAKRKATYQAWAQSEKGQVALKSYQRAYHKAYYKVFMSSGDRQLARIAGQQAGALLRVSDKTKKNEHESGSVTSVLPAF